MEQVLETIILTMDTPAMCVRTGLITRLLTWRRRGMVPASTAGFLRLRFKDSNSAQFSGIILLLLWWMFQTLEGHKEKDMETLRLRLTRQMIITQTLPQLSRLLRHTLRITLTCYLAKIATITAKIPLQIL